MINSFNEFKSALEKLGLDMTRCGPYQLLKSNTDGEHSIICEFNFKNKIKINYSSGVCGPNGIAEANINAGEWARVFRFDYLKEIKDIDLAIKYCKDKLFEGIPYSSHYNRKFDQIIEHNDLPFGRIVFNTYNNFDKAYLIAAAYINHFNKVIKYEKLLKIKTIGLEHENYISPLAYAC